MPQTKKSCYLCGLSNCFERKGVVRDNPHLKINQCGSCGLVFLSSQDHVVEQFYEQGGMFAYDTADMNDFQSRLIETAQDDERRLNFLYPLLCNKNLLDFGCGLGGFLLKAKKNTQKADGIEPAKASKN